MVDDVKKLQQEIVKLKADNAKLTAALAALEKEKTRSNDELRGHILDARGREILAHEEIAALKAESAAKIPADQVERAKNSFAGKLAVEQAAREKAEAALKAQLATPAPAAAKPAEPEPKASSKSSRLKAVEPAAEPAKAKSSRLKAVDPSKK